MMLPKQVPSDFGSLSEYRTAGLTCSFSSFRKKDPQKIAVELLSKVFPIMAYNILLHPSLTEVILGVPDAAFAQKQLRTESCLFI